ncbi:helix-turn-helix transcriptional regulator [Streptomyces sp. AV19]|uniref:helix-turn-helix domain-containing protein n=1 Tax=Streptomyces sp. AV19 TaxID=2793068 RepID=UPI0027DC5745|nr:helix-turn-helix transcriptional regulator [Streptomyces sp. AV19]
MTAGRIGKLPPTWRYCGNQVKLWRFRAGVSREELAKEANYTIETVKAMEQGRRRPTPRLLQVADELCGAQGMLLAALGYLMPEPYEPDAKVFVDAEAQAVAVSSYQTMHIPGLLQTEEYARALMSTAWPPVDDEVIEQRVAGRMQRQAKVTSKPLAVFNFVIHECALRMGVGGPMVMKRQLLRLLDASALPNVLIQVLPIPLGHGGLGGPFVLLETEDHEHFGYVEGQETHVMHTGVETVGNLT